MFNAGLTSLSLANNLLTELPDTLSLCLELTHLDLQQNGLHALPASFCALQWLEMLNLTDNCFQRWPAVLADIGDSLRELRLAKNSLGPKLVFSNATTNAKQEVRSDADGAGSSNTTLNISAASGWEVRKMLAPMRSLCMLDLSENTFHGEHCLPWVVSYSCTTFVSSYMLPGSVGVPGVWWW